MNTFNHEGKYVCECGKEFTKSQSFNAHKSSCKVHMMTKGMSEEDYHSLQSRRRKTRAISSAIIRSNRVKSRYEEWSRSILDGSHKCLNCGKVLTEIYASGRFCCESCSRSYVSTHQSEESKSSKVKKLAKGWKLYGKRSYPEVYWSSVLKTLNYNYEEQYLFKSPNKGYYRFDFLINNVILEIDGGFHYNNGLLRNSDKIRDEYILSNSEYRIIRIRYIKDIPINKNKINSQIRDLIDFIKDESIRYKLI